ncbi:MAG: hypothetical protein MZU84_03620 [Sphingobacterium sp.]|nr:hypothetical protein [Sphingobacterium sp.]
MPWNYNSCNIQTLDKVFARNGKDASPGIMGWNENMAFSLFADKDGDGKVTEEEKNRAFALLSGEGCSIYRSKEIY